MKTIIRAAIIAALAIPAGLAMGTGPAAAGDWKKCTHEGGFCNSGEYFTKIRYGVGGAWRYKTTSGGAWCTNAEFGDPAQGRGKNCYVYVPNWEYCNHEGGFCDAGGHQLVRYGTNPHRSGQYRERNTGNGGVWCTNAEFGDPAQGRSKSCWVFK